MGGNQGTGKKPKEMASETCNLPSHNQKAVKMLEIPNLCLMLVEVKEYATATS